jgi:hypothetical protein
MILAPGALFVLLPSPMMRRKVPRIGKKIICFAKLGRAFEKKLNAGTRNLSSRHSQSSTGEEQIVNFRLSLGFHAP